MKKKLTVLCLPVICAALAVSGTLAFFTSEDTAHNVITTGGVGIELTQTIVDAGGVQVAFPPEGLTGMMPGTSVSGIVSVKNTGVAEAWIRARVDIIILPSASSLSGGEHLPLTIREGGKIVQAVSFTVDDEDWLWEDGYYYYTAPVSPGGSTNALFDQVHFAKEMGNAYQNCTVHIDIAAEAVQTANNPIPAGGDVTDVPGWPEA